MKPDMSLVEMAKAHLIHPLTHPRDFELHHPPRVIVEGEGVMIRDSEGKEYIDGFAGLWCMAVGHSHPRIIEAVHAQMKKLSYFTSFHGMSSPRPSSWPQSSRACSIPPTT